MFGILSLLLTYIQSRTGVGGIFAYAQQQQLNSVTDPLSDSLHIAQSKVQAAMSPGAFGHGVPSLYNIPIQDLLMILGITALGSALAYVIVSILLNRTKENKKKMALYQQ